MVLKMNKEKKYKLASALSYKLGDNAPVIVAKGKGLIAEKIVENAKVNKIPVHVDADCAKLLSYVDIDSEVPEELYEVVAKILVFVGNIDKKFK